MLAVKPVGLLGLLVQPLSLSPLLPAQAECRKRKKEKVDA